MPLKRSISDLIVAGKTVLVRVDYNVPLIPGSDEISDDSRIKASIPTIKYLMSEGAKVVLCSHLGRPNGRIVEKLRLTKVSQRLAELLHHNITMSPGCVGEEVENLVSSSSPNSLIMLENLRFHEGEEANDPAFAKALASLADIYVTDAFATAHRAHASTQGVARYLPSAAGLLLEHELEMLGKTLKNPKRPFNVVLGGAKVSDKIGMISHLSEKADAFLIGGGMSAAFLKAAGYSIGGSNCPDADVNKAQGVIDMKNDAGFQLFTPTDVVIGNRFEEHAMSTTVSVSDIFEDWIVMDIGIETSVRYNTIIQNSETILWNGPMGVFEWDQFSHGSRRVAASIAESKGTSITGGGSTAEVLYTLGLDGAVSHVSTGGGATLEYLEGHELPGIVVIPDA